MVKHLCKVCKEEVPEGRVKLGYRDSCVKHSTTSKYSGNIVADHKSTTWIDIVRDPEAAKDIERLSTTRGRGSI